MQGIRFLVIALAAAMTLSFASVVWTQSAPTNQVVAVPPPLPSRMTRVAPDRTSESIVAQRPVPGYPPRPADVPGWYAQWGGTQART